MVSYELSLISEMNSSNHVVRQNGIFLEDEYLKDP